MIFIISGPETLKRYQKQLFETLFSKMLLGGWHKQTKKVLSIVLQKYIIMIVTLFLFLIRALTIWNFKFFCS